MKYEARDKIRFCVSSAYRNPQAVQSHFAARALFSTILPIAKRGPNVNEV